jgi:beta-ureidopropionase / N-carbamoyl-L-amino-acid hydrolase
VVFALDSRHPDDALLAELEGQMRRACETIGAAASLGVDIEYVGGRPTVSFDPDCVGAVRRAADRLGLAHIDVYSGAGHDACNLARYAPTGMIFVPCERGVSHNEKEYASPEALAAGCNVLLHVILERAEVA